MLDLKLCKDISLVSIGYANEISSLIQNLRKANFNVTEVIHVTVTIYETDEALEAFLSIIDCFNLIQDECLCKLRLVYIQDEATTLSDEELSYPNIYCCKQKDFIPTFVHIQITAYDSKQ